MSVYINLQDVWEASYVMAIHLEGHLEIVCWMEERNLVCLLEGICDVIAIKNWFLLQWAIHIHHSSLA